MAQELIDYFYRLVTDERRELFEKNIKLRTRYLTVALEDIFQPQNASAVLRTCDCFGIQDVHIIENKNKYNINPDVALGSFKWLNLIKYNKGENNTKPAIEALKKGGYRIIATTPHENAINLEDFNLEKGKAALFFGTEVTGLTKEVLDNADEYLKIPMYGFSESFNISVSAAVILHCLTSSLRASTINWALTEEESKAIKLNWLRNSVKKSKIIENEYFKRKNNAN